MKSVLTPTLILTLILSTITRIPSPHSLPQLHGSSSNIASSTYHVFDTENSQPQKAKWKTSPSMLCITSTSTSCSITISE